MGEPKSTCPGLHLDLNKFSSADAEKTRRVLTTPRSPEPCARLGVKPVELLIKSLNELIAEKNDDPSEVMRVMHESYERERTKLLKREERERITQEDGDRWPGGHRKVSGLDTLPDIKLKDHPTDKQTFGSMPYADLCLKGKCLSRLSGSATGNVSTVGSISLGDFRHSPATEMKLEKITKDIKKKMCVRVSERDCKIAALMLVKHQEEQASQKLCQQEEQDRQEARRREEAQKAQAEKRRRKKLKQNMKRWQEELDTHRRLREQREEERTGQLEQEVLLQENRWRRVKEEVDAQRREKIEAAKKEAKGRKRYQEKLLREKEEAEKRERERERQVALEREQTARRSKALKEKKEKKRLEEGNRREQLRHILLKQQVEQRVKEEEVLMRSVLERKLQQSCEKHAQAAEVRLRELQESAAREEKQIQRARLKAELQSIQELTHKRVLVQLSRRRMERAAQYASARHRTRAQQTHEHNRRRQLCHQKLRERMQREEEAMRKVRESWICMKEWRRERLQRQREQILEEAHRLARASFHMRERVRQQTHTRTFDQMALEAQLSAHMSRMKV